MFGISMNLLKGIRSPIATDDVCACLHVSMFGYVIIKGISNWIEAIFPDQSS